LGKLNVLDHIRADNSVKQILEFTLKWPDQQFCTESGGRGEGGGNAETTFGSSKEAGP
jgi:hypothetical protein